MSQKNWMIPRRTFLRGVGATLGLPLLDAMGRLVPAASPEAVASSAPSAQVQAPVRMACIYFPNGVWEKNWFPEKEGADYELPFALEPLARHKKDFLVFSKLDKKHSHQGDGHYAKTANFLTGLPVRKTPGKDISVGGVSIDQYAAQHVGQYTPLPSLELGIDPVVSGIDSVVGYTRLYGCYISWRNPSTPVAKEINPRFAYVRLFGVIQASKGSTADAKKVRIMKRCSFWFSMTRTRCGGNSDAMTSINSMSISNRYVTWNGGWNSFQNRTRAIGNRKLK